MLACRASKRDSFSGRAKQRFLCRGEHATWLKIRNQSYSQRVGREALFERSEPLIPIWRLGSLCPSLCDFLERLGKGLKRTLS